MFQTCGNGRDTETVMPGGKFLSSRHIEWQNEHDAEKDRHKQRFAATEDASSHEISLCPRAGVRCREILQRSFRLLKDDRHQTSPSSFPQRRGQIQYATLTEIFSVRKKGACGKLPSSLFWSSCRKLRVFLAFFDRKSTTPFASGFMPVSHFCHPAGHKI
jgi:hypothetical protein